MGDTSTGVSNDLQKVSQIARNMVCSYGMSDKLDKLAFGNQHQPMFLGRDIFDEKNYSEDTSRKIDEEIHSLVHDAYNRAKKLILENRDKLDLLAQKLIEKETVDIEEARVLLGIPEHKLNAHQDAA
jgi:cell division protease FtsH